MRYLAGEEKMRYKLVWRDSCTWFLFRDPSEAGNTSRPPDIKYRLKETGERGGKARRGSSLLHKLFPTKKRYCDKPYKWQTREKISPGRSAGQHVCPLPFFEHPPCWKCSRNIQWRKRGTRQDFVWFMPCTFTFTVYSYSSKIAFLRSQWLNEHGIFSLGITVFFIFLYYCYWACTVNTPT